MNIHEIVVFIHHLYMFRGNELPMKQHIISALVENRAGTLSRVSGFFSRCWFNIDSLTVGVTEDPTVSRMAIAVNAEPSARSSRTPDARASTCEATGDLDKLNGLLLLLRPYGILELVRTGLAALERGSNIMKSEQGTMPD